MSKLEMAIAAATMKFNAAQMKLRAASSLNREARSRAMVRADKQLKQLQNQRK